MVLIVKVGGALGVDYDAVCADLAGLHADGVRWILVHGGSAETDQVAAQLGHPPEHVTSVSGYVSRRTDRRTMEIFEMVYCGKTNKGIVERLQARGVDAIGLSGLDGRLLEGTRKAVIKILDKETGRARVLRDDYTGTVEDVNTELLETLMAAGYAPVVCPPAISHDSEAINVDGDRAAAAIAASLQADTLVILSNVAGVLSDFPDQRSLIPRIAREDLEFVRTEHAAGRMRIKLLAAGEALAAGVGRVVIGNSMGLEPVRAALAGQGTVIE
ncbi:MAG TPA: [LysW]-aminoadipate kinase [Planctomycetota bacterium]